MGTGTIFCMNCGQKLPAEAKFCFACGQRVETGSCHDAAGGVLESVPCRQEDMGGPAESSETLTLAEFRAQASSWTGFREQLLAYRKSLPHNWDHNAFVGILLGVRGPKHGDAACMNFAIGQGDNGNNTKKTLDVKGLMPVFEKYKGKNLNAAILLSDVEDEILAIAPDYAPIRDKFHEIVFAGAGGEVGAAEAPAVHPHQNAVSAAPAAEDIPHAVPVAAETKPMAAEPDDASEIIDFFVEVLAFRVLAYVTDDKTVERADIKEKFQKWSGKLEYQRDQQEFETYFGTSAEAKWLYSARDIVFSSMPSPYFDFSNFMYKIDEAFSLLQKLPEGKYGIAYYALARCYGVGIDAVIGTSSDKDNRVYVLRPNVGEMVRYLKLAAQAQRPEKEALVDLGCVELSVGKYQKAKPIFEEAEKLGARNASVYLRYIECCEHAVPAINGQRTTNDTKEQYLYGNIIEYKGRVYWMCMDKQTESGYGCRYDGPTLLCSLGADGKRTILAEMKPASSMTLGRSASDVGLAFSICNDLIYYENGSGGISTMRLDGSDKRELPDLTNNGKINVHMPVRMPMAFPGFFLYTIGSGSGTIWKRDQNGVKTKVGTIRGRIVGVSEREINIENRELIDLRTLERRKVTEKYPALKKKTVFYIDMAREIAYYEDNTDTGDYKDRRLIGVNTRGEVVDYWEIPLMPYDCSSLPGCASFCFNGQRLSFKIDAVEEALRKTYGFRSKPFEEYMELWKKQGLSEREWPHVALFDRRGNRMLLNKRKDEDWDMLWGSLHNSAYIFGAFHMMTENGIVVLETHGQMEYWNTYYPIFKGGIPAAKLDFF